MKNSSYIYRHRRLDTNEVFYIGIGKTKNFKRAYSKSSRNKFWKNIINKTDYIVEILTFDVSWEDACELEILLISEYGRRDLGTGCLVNLTDGGEGNTGIRVNTSKLKGKRQSKDHIRNNSISRIGGKRSEKTKQKMSKTHKNKKYCLGYTHNEEHKRRNSISTSKWIYNTPLGEFYGEMSAAKAHNCASRTIVVRVLSEKIKYKDYNRKLK